MAYPLAPMNRFPKAEVSETRKLFEKQLNLLFTNDLVRIVQVTRWLNQRRSRIARAPSGKSAISAENVVCGVLRLGCGEDYESAIIAKALEPAGDI
jgi:hypothetical protein